MGDGKWTSGSLNGVGKLRLSSLLSSAWAPPHPTSTEALIELPLPAKEGRCPVTYTDCNTIAIMETTGKALEPKPTGPTGGRRGDSGRGLNHSLPTVPNAQTLESSWEPPSFARENCQSGGVCHGEHPSFCQPFPPPPTPSSSSTTHTKNWIHFE